MFDPSGCMLQISSGMKKSGRMLPYFRTIENVALDNRKYYVKYDGDEGWEDYSNMNALEKSTE